MTQTSAFLLLSASAVRTVETAVRLRYIDANIDLRAREMIQDALHRYLTSLEALVFLPVPTIPEKELTTATARTWLANLRGNIAAQIAALEDHGTLAFPEIADWFQVQRALSDAKLVQLAMQQFLPVEDLLPSHSL